MIVSARGPRRNRVWGEMQPRLGRDAGASGSRCGRVWGKARSHAGAGSPRVSRAWFVDKPTIHALHGGAECGVGLRFQNMGGCAACKLVFKR